MTALRVGTFLAPSLRPVYQMITDEIGRRLGLEAHLVTETDYETYRADLDDVSFICGLPYVAFERESVAPAVPVAAPVLKGARYEGRPIYFSDVIVHRDSDIYSFQDLRGRSWAYNEPLSQSGYGITRQHLLELGETTGFFGRVVQAGFHQKAIRMVAERRVDGSAIDSQVLEIEMRDHPELEDTIRTIDSLGPSTIQPVTVSWRLPPDMRDEIVDALIHLHEDAARAEVMEMGLVERFVRVGPADYDDIRRMLAASQGAGFTELS